MYKIYFEGFWNNFDIENNFFTKLLKKYYNISINSKNYDVVIVSCFNKKKIDLKKNVRKIFYTGENINYKKDYDFNFTFKPNSVKNIRLPLWVINYKNNPNFDYHVQYEKNSFCCFVASNNIKYRNDFCNLLSKKYKKVDCGGKCLNNINRIVEDKITFQRKYKFCIVFENYSSPGYVTEKILDSYRSWCVPIYWGAKNIEIDFNPKTFINVHDFNNLHDLIDYIIKVDNDDELYQSYFKETIFSNYWKNILNDKDEKFFKNICKKILHLKR